jgi:16S rRNA (adenine1518-N6/adenine1519-N6)-dimethyltransferase
MQIKPKRRLGQNFLVDANIQKKIIGALELRPTDVILEIGAGSGQLTGLIAQKAKKVYALEIDRNLCEILKDNLKGRLNVEIINCDILKFNLRAYFGQQKGKIKVVGNIPYYISSPIIEHLINYRKRISSIFITVQKEFAKRVIARAGSKDYGSFSCFVQYYMEPEIIFNIKKTCFRPAPKVDSSLLSMKIRRKPLLKKEQEEFFFKVVRAAFNKRRKTLRNSLHGIISLDKLRQFFVKFDIDINTRPEQLSREDFINLAEI